MTMTMTFDSATYECACVVQPTSPSSTPTQSSPDNFPKTLAHINCSSF